MHSSLAKKQNPFVTMNKLNLLFLFLFLSFYSLSYSQINENRQVERYMLKQVFDKHYTTKDSLGFMVRDNDTLIRIDLPKNLEPKGIAVKYEYKDSTFLELYKKIAFRVNHKDSVNTRPMKYWKEGINIYFSKSISKPVIKDIMNFANQVDSAVDSLHISQVKKLEQSNYVIYTETDYQYEINLENKKDSDSWVYWNKKNQITKAFIRIIKSQTFSEKLEKQKIKELLFNSLGFFVPNNELSCENYFSNCHSDNKHLTTLDLELLKYHYSYGICKGTTRTTFEEQHRQCKITLKKNNIHSLFYHN